MVTHRPGEQEKELQVWQWGAAAVRLGGKREKKNSSFYGLPNAEQQMD